MFIGLKMSMDFRIVLFDDHVPCSFLTFVLMDFFVDFKDKVNNEDWLNTR